MNKVNEKKNFKSFLESKDEYDNEGSMAKGQLKTMIDAAQQLHDMLSDDENMPEWVQSKITKATDYIDTARDYMKSQDSKEVNEKKKKLTRAQRNKKMREADKARERRIRKGNPFNVQT